MKKKRDVISIGSLLLAAFLSLFICFPASSWADVLTQTLSISPSSTTQSVNQTFEFIVNYSATDKSQGPAFRIHYNSKKLTFVELKDLASIGFPMGPTSGDEDGSNKDEDSSTDKWVSMGWLEPSGNYPADQQQLFIAVFKVNQDAYNGVTNLNIVKNNNALPDAIVVSASGMALTIENGKDAPSTPVISPASGQFHKQAVSVTATVDDAPVQTFYTLDGTEPNENSDEYTGDPIVVDGDDGATKALKMKSFDLSEPISGATATATFKFDKAAPATDFTSHSKNQQVYVTDSSVTITGTVADPGTGSGVASVQISIDDKNSWNNATVNGDGTWTYDATLALGNNLIWVRGTDNVGNVEVMGQTDLTTITYYPPVKLTVNSNDVTDNHIYVPRIEGQHTRQIYITGGDGNGDPANYNHYVTEETPNWGADTAQNDHLLFTANLTGTGSITDTLTISDPMDTSVYKADLQITVYDFGFSQKPEKGQLNNTVNFETTGQRGTVSWEVVDPSDVLGDPAVSGSDNEQAAFLITGVGTATVKATDANGAVISTEITTYGLVDHYELSFDGQFNNVAGNTNTINVIARDNSDPARTVENFDGQADFSIDGASQETLTFVNGVAQTTSFNNVTTSGDHTYRVATQGGAEGQLIQTVVPAAAHSIKLELSRPAIASNGQGSKTTLTATVQDTYANTVTSLNDTQMTFNVGNDPGNLAEWATETATITNGVATIELGSAAKEVGGSGQATVELTATDGTLTSAPAVDLIIADFKLTIDDGIGYKPVAEAFNLTANGALSQVAWSVTQGADIVDALTLSGDNKEHAKVQFNSPGQAVIQASEDGKTVDITIKSYGPAVNFTVSPPSVFNGTAGATNTFTVTAVDENGNTVENYTGEVQFDLEDPEAVPSPLAYTFTTGQDGDNGSHAFDLTYKTAGQWDVKVQDAQDNTINGKTAQKMTITHAQANKVVLVSDKDTISSNGLESAGLTATVQDAFGNPVTDYTADVDYTVTGTNTQWTSKKDDQVTGGVSTVSLLSEGKAQGTVTVKVVATSGNLTGSNEVSIDIVDFEIDPETATIQVGTDITLDVTGALGDLTWTVIEGSDLVGTAQISGTRNSHALYPVTGIGTIKIQAEEGGKTLVATFEAYGLVDSFKVDGPSSTITAGTSQDFTVTALDSEGNTVLNYGGSVILDPGDPRLQSLNYTFQANENGVHTFQVALETAGQRTVTATGDSKTGSGTFTVTAADAVSLDLDVTPVVISSEGKGTATLTAVIKDTYDNIVPSDGDNIEFAITGNDVSNVAWTTKTVATAQNQAQTTVDSKDRVDGANSKDVTVTVTRGQLQPASKTLTISNYAIVPADSYKQVGDTVSLETIGALGPVDWDIVGQGFGTLGTPTGTNNKDVIFTITGVGTTTVSATEGEKTVTATIRSYGAASKFKVEYNSFDNVAGNENTITVTAQDAENNTVETFEDTITITAPGDSKFAVNPSNAEGFTAADKGVKTFKFTLKTTGNQTVTVTSGNASGNITGTVTGTVVASAPNSITLEASKPKITSEGKDGLELIGTLYDVFGNVVEEKDAGDMTFTVTGTNVDNNAPTGVFNDGVARAALASSGVVGGDGSTTVSIVASADGINSNAVQVEIHDFTLTPVTSKKQVGQQLQITVSGAIHPVTWSVTEGGVLAFPGTYSGTNNAVAGFEVTGVGTEVVKATMGEGDNAVTITSSVTTYGALDHFDVAFSNFNATAGVENTITVTAKDARNNTVENYTGTVSLTAPQDPQLEKAQGNNYTFAANEAGVKTLALTLKTAGEQMVVITGDTKQGSVTKTVAPAAAVALALDVTPAVISSEGNGTATLTAVIKDTFGNTVPGQGQVIKFEITGAGADNVAWTSKTVPTTAENQAQTTVASKDRVDGADSKDATITVTRDGLQSASQTLRISNYAIVPADSYKQVGDTVSLEVIGALSDVTWNIVGEGFGTLGTPTGANNKDVVFTITGVGTTTVSATAGENTVTATIRSYGAASKFKVEYNSFNNVAGNENTITVTAQDAEDNSVENFEGPITITADGDSQFAVNPANAEGFAADDKGVKTFKFTLKTTGEQTVTVSSGNIAGTVTGTVVAAAPASIALQASKPKITSEGKDGLELTGTIYDGFGNIVEAKHGTPMTFTVTGTKVDNNTPSGTLDKGVAKAALASSGVVGGNGSTTVSIVASEGGIDSNVVQVEIHDFTLTPATSKKQVGQQLQITVSGAIHPVTWSVTNGGILTFPGSYSGTNNAVAGFDVTGIGTEVVKATMGEGNNAVTITSEVTTYGALDHFEVVFDNFNATAGEENTITVTAKDSQNNTVENYTGTVSLTAPQDSQFEKAQGNNYTFSANETGVKKLALTLKTAGDQTVVITGDSKQGSASGTVVPAGEAALALELSPAVISSDGNGTATLTAVIKDAFGNTVDSNDEDVAFSVTGDGTVNVEWTDKTVKTASGVATATIKSKGTVENADSKTVTIEVSKGQLTKDSKILTISNFAIDPVDSYKQVGQTVALEAIGALSPVGWAIVGDGFGTLGTPSGINNKDVVFTITGVGTTTVSATEGGKTVTATIRSYGAVGRFKVEYNNFDNVAGNKNTITVTAQDAEGNTVENFVGDVTITSTDSNFELDDNNASSFIEDDKGVKTFKLSLKTAGEQTVTVTSGAVSGAVTDTVTHAAAFKIDLVSDVTAIVSNGGTKATLTATLQDEFGNTVTQDADADFDADANDKLTQDSIVITNDTEFVQGVATAEITYSQAVGQTGGQIDVDAVYQLGQPGEIRNQEDLIIEVVDFTITPKEVATSQIGDTIDYNVAGARGTVAWQITGKNGSGNVGTLGSYSGAHNNTAVLTITAAGSSTITVTDGDLRASATVNAYTDVAIVGKPAGTLTVSGEQTFTVTGGDESYTWTVTGGPVAVAGGTGASFTFTAPKTGAFAGTYTVTVTDGVGTNSDSFTIYVPLILKPAATDISIMASADPKPFTMTGAAEATAYTRTVANPDNTTQNVSVAAAFNAQNQSQFSLNPKAAPFDSVSTATGSQLFTLDFDFDEATGLKAPPTAPVNITIIPVNEVTFEGNIVGTDGVGIDGVNTNATVTVVAPRSLKGQSVTVDANGYFKFPAMSLLEDPRKGVKTVCKFEVTANGFLSREFKSTDLSETAVVDITIQSSGSTVAGRIIDGNDAAKSGAQVVLFTAAGKAGGPVVTANDGTFTFELSTAFSDPVNYTLTASAKDGTDTLAGDKAVTANAKDFDAGDLKILKKEVPEENKVSGATPAGGSVVQGTVGGSITIGAGEVPAGMQGIALELVVEPHPAGGTAQVALPVNYTPTAATSERGVAQPIVWEINGLAHDQCVTIPVPCTLEDAMAIANGTKFIWYLNDTSGEWKIAPVNPEDISFDGDNSIVEVQICEWSSNVLGIGGALGSAGGSVIPGVGGGCFISTVTPAEKSAWPLAAGGLLLLASLLIGKRGKKNIR